jgi:hypothetical protein
VPDRINVPDRITVLDRITAPDRTIVQCAPRDPPRWR